MHTQTRTCLGAFGAERPKPIIMTSNRAWPQNLQRSVAGMTFPSCEEAGVVRSVVGADGRRAFSGGPALKETESYPEQFGVELCNEWLQHDQDEMVAHLHSTYNPNDITDLTNEMNPRWDLCDLDGCLEAANST